MKNSEKICAIFFAIAVLAAFSLKVAEGIEENNQAKTITENIKSGRFQLYCRFSNGERQIAPEKLKEVVIVENQISYNFTNGYATNCYVSE